MARRQTIIAAAISAVALLGIMRMARAATGGSVYDDFGNWSLDAELDAGAPGLLEEIMAITQPDPTQSLSHPNVRAILDMIGSFEGGPQGYNALFGGGRFESFADHPRTIIAAGGYSSSAAGRYQILEGTWNDVRGTIGATDFSPYWQDVAAVYLIRRRGALQDVIDGNFDAAIGKLGKEWASLPGSPYGQPMRSLADARASYADAGGSFA